MAKKSIAKNYLYNVAYEILAIIIPLITMPYISRVLGAEKIGVYGFTSSIVTYFILFGSLGVTLYAKREIAYVQDNVKERSKTFYEIFSLKFITLSLSMLLFYFSFCLNGEYTTYYKILVMVIIAYIFDISWFLQGMEEFKKTVVRNALIKIISTICIFIFIKNQNDLWKYFLIYSLSTLFGNISLLPYLSKYLVKVSFKELNIKKHLKPIIILFIPQIATQLYTVFDKTMIGLIIADKSEVGYYEQAQKIVKLLLTIATSFGTIMMPRIAATYAKGDDDKIKEYMNKSFSFILMLSFPLMFGISSISSHFVPVFYGNGYDKVIYLICIISPILVLVGLSNVTGTQYLLPTMQQNKYTASVISGAAVNFFLNYVLIKKHGAIGASIATVISEIMVTFVQFFLIRNQIKFTDVIKNSYKYFVASFIMFIVSMVIGYFINNNFISIITQGAISIITYFSVLIIMKDRLIFEMINAIRQKIINIKMGVV